MKTSRHISWSVEFNCVEFGCVAASFVNELSGNLLLWRSKSFPSRLRD